MAFPIDVDICNSALSSVGTRSTIASIDEDSEEARQCKRWYASTLLQGLRAAHWGFAKKMTMPALFKAAPGTAENPSTANVTGWDPSQPQPPWSYEYVYPTDCIMGRYVQSQNMVGPIPSIPIFTSPTAQLPLNFPKVPFEVGNDVDSQANQLRVIMTNASKAILCYTVLVTDQNLWDPFFNNMIIAALAASVTMGLTGDKQLAQMLNGQANSYIAQARAQDANESLTVIDIPTDWIQARTFYAPSFAGNFIAPYGPLFTVV